MRWNNNNWSQKRSKMSTDTKFIDLVSVKDDFILLNESNNKCSLFLNERAVCIEYKHRIIYVSYADIIGCNVSNKDNLIFNTTCYSSTQREILTRYPSSAFLFIYSYFLKKMALSAFKRHKCHYVLCYNKYSEPPENISRVLMWKNSIQHLIKQRCPIQSIPAEISSGRKYLVLLNPFSGRGSARKLYDRQVIKMFNEALFNYELIKTEKQNHAFEIAKNLKLEDWEGIIVISGDGLLYEVINGLMDREDKAKAITIPVGIIAAGTGNGLSCSLNYYAGEPYRNNITLHSTFMVLKHTVTPMDLTVVQTPTMTLYSFLSLTGGIFADVDYESENMRFLGFMRITIGALMCIVNLRSYRIRLSYLPVVEYSNSNVYTDELNGLVGEADVDKNSEEVTKGNIGTDDADNTEASNVSADLVKSHKFSSCKRRVKLHRSFVLTSTTEMSLTTNPQTKIDVDDDLNGSKPNGAVENINGQLNNGATNREMSREALEKISNSGQYPAGCHVTSEAEDEIVYETIKAEFSDESNMTPLLTPLGEPVPENWTVVEGEFVTLIAVNQGLLSPDHMVAPQKRHDDGCIQILTCKKGINRRRLIKLMDMMTEGSHIDESDVDIIKVLAYRLEPLSGNSLWMVDGEPIPFTPVQGQILPGLARVMSLPP